MIKGMRSREEAAMIKKQFGETKKSPPEKQEGD